MQGSFGCTWSTAFNQRTSPKTPRLTGAAKNTHAAHGSTSLLSCAYLEQVCFQKLPGVNAFLHAAARGEHSCKQLTGQRGPYKPTSLLQSLTLSRSFLLRAEPIQPVVIKSSASALACAVLSAAGAELNQVFGLNTNVTAENRQLDQLVVTNTA